MCICGADSLIWNDEFLAQPFFRQSHSPSLASNAYTHTLARRVHVAIDRSVRDKKRHEWEKSSHRIASNRFAQAVSRNLLTLRLHVVRFRSPFNENLLLSLPCCRRPVRERVRVQRDRQWKHTAVHLTGAKSISCLQAFYIFIFIFSARISDFFPLPFRFDASERHMRVSVAARRHRSPQSKTIWDMAGIRCSVPSDDTEVSVEVDWLKTCKLVRVWQSFWVRLKACCDAYILSGHQHPSVLAPIRLMIYAPNRRNIVAMMHIRSDLIFQGFPK